MSAMILLAAADATHVQGPSASRPAAAGLTPIALTDGTFYLPADVLTDADHQEFWAYLGALPRADSDSISSLFIQ